MKKKILITGSSGFLGSRLAYLLKDKYDLPTARMKLNSNILSKNINVRNSIKALEPYE